MNTLIITDKPSVARSIAPPTGSDGRRKRMNRTSRNLLLLSLVLVAAVNLLVNMDIMGQAMANVLSLVGIILLVLALWFQFRDPTGGGQSGVNAPRLR